MYGLQIMDSWLYDENEPFMHMQAIPTFEYLKEQISTGYFEKLIQTYLLDNQHGSIVIVKPEKDGQPEWTKSWRKNWQLIKQV